MHSKEVLARLSEIGSGSMRDFLDIPQEGDWSLNLKKAKRRQKLGLLKKIKLKRETRWEKTGKTGLDGREIKEPVVTDQLEIELLDQTSALDKLAKYHGLYDKKPEVKTAERRAVVTAARDIAEQRRRDRRTDKPPG